MYQALIVRRYLLSRVMPWLAVVAVMLCTAMVLTVWSVMTGFLGALLASGQAMAGDATIARPVQGIPHYEALVESLESDPRIAAATPTIETLALIRLPYGQNRTVQLVGIDPDGYDAVTGFREHLWWRGGDDGAFVEGDLRRTLDPGFADAGAALTWPPTGSPEGASAQDAIVMGINIWPFNRWDPAGFVSPDLAIMMPGRGATVVAPALSRSGALIEASTRRMPIANEFRTGLIFSDGQDVLMRLDEVQRMLRMDEARRVSGSPRLVRGDDGVMRVVTPTEGVSPARVTHIVTRAAAGATSADAAAACREAYDAFARSHADAPSPERVTVMRWDERPGVATFIAAVRKEISLVLFLFGLISLTPAFLVFSIFWSMVSEKTKDIGVLRAIGAGKRGVAWLFIRYGLLIGVSGAVLGVALASAVVWNINPIHAMLAERLGVVIWDPGIYAFDSLPDTIDPVHALAVFASGVVVAAAGAVVPAIRAANMDPVRAIRFE